MDENVAISWSAYEHDHVERGSDWYWALGIVAVCGALTSILFHDVFFAIIIVLAAFILGYLARTPLELMYFKVSDEGIWVGDELHKYKEVISFWVEEEHGDRPHLLVDTIKFLSPNLIIPIEDVDPREVRAYLKERVKEVEMREPAAHKILEFFGI
jgi:hypothetical protein